MNRFLNISFAALHSAGHVDPAREADRVFPDVVRQSSLRLFQPSEPMPASGIRILLGIATWSMYDLRLLDVIDTGLTQLGRKNLLVDVFNIGSLTQEELERLIPGVGPVFHPPVLGVWRDGILLAAASGGAARDRVAQMFGSNSDEIVQFVREQILPPTSAQRSDHSTDAVVT